MISEIREIATHFELDGNFVAADRYERGHINDTFLVSVERRDVHARYIFQRINKHVFRDPVSLMENIWRITEHLQAKDPGSRSSLSLVAANDGSFLFLDDDTEYWRAYRFVEGACTYDEVQSTMQAREAAAAFGRFQNLVCDLRAPRLHETIPDFHNTPARYRQFYAILERDPFDRARHCGAEIDRARSCEGAAGALVALQNAGELPERITHNDTKLNNVLFDERSGKAICVIDLDTVMPGLALYDFGDLVRTVTTSAREDEADLAKIVMRMDYFKALAEGYLSAALEFLSDAEIGHLAVAGEVITIETGLRFLTDYLSGDEYFRIHRPQQNLDRCRAQFALAASIGEQHGQMQSAISRLVASMKRENKTG